MSPTGLTSFTIKSELYRKIDSTQDRYTFGGTNEKILLVTGVSLLLFGCGSKEGTSDSTHKQQAAQAEEVEPTGNHLGGGYQDIKWGMSKEEVKKGMQGRKILGETDAGIAFEGNNGLSISCYVSQGKLYSVALKFADPETLTGAAFKKMMPIAQKLGAEGLGPDEEPSMALKEVFKPENYLSEIESLQSALNAKFGVGKMVANASLETPFGELPVVKTAWEDSVTRITSQYVKPGTSELQEAIYALNPKLRYGAPAARAGGEFAVTLTMVFKFYSITYSNKELLKENERLEKQKAAEAQKAKEAKKAAKNLGNI